jgi:hypothetical protein
MTLVISKGITLRKGYIGTDDPDAEAYIAAVEAADEAESPGVGALETATKVAIHSFVKGCKNDGIWPAIKASCILAGARTLTGALVPLVGTAPTNNNFVSGDYNRKTGLVGDGSTKFLDSNRNNNADPQDSKHLSVYASSRSTTANMSYLGMAVASGSTHFTSGFLNNNVIGLRINSSSGVTSVVSNANGFMAIQRANSTEITGRGGGVTISPTGLGSTTPASGNLLVFDGLAKTDARLAFYSIGESLDLALLDARVTDLINAFAAAIP